MNAVVVAVQKHKAPRPPRAVRIPEILTDTDIDDVLYDFGFEYWGPGFGTQRLLHITDDSIDDYMDAKDVMQRENTDLALFDRDQKQWVAVHPGDWVVEPQDADGEGFIQLTDEQFHAEWEVVTT